MHPNPNLNTLAKSAGCLDEKTRDGMAGLGTIVKCDEFYISVALSRYKRVGLDTIQKIFESSKNYELKPAERFKNTLHAKKRGRLIFEFNMDEEGKCRHLVFYAPCENRECIKKFMEQYENLNRRYLNDETEDRISGLGYVRREGEKIFLTIKKAGVQLKRIEGIVRTLDGHFLKENKAEHTLQLMAVPGEGQPVITMSFRGKDCANMLFNSTDENKELIAEFVEKLCQK